MKKIKPWTEKEKADLRNGIIPEGRTASSIINMKKRIGLVSPQNTRKRWSQESIDLLKSFVKQGKSALQIYKSRLLPYNQNSIQKQMGRLGLSKKTIIKKLSKNKLDELKNFLKQNWDKYIPEILVEKWNEKNTPKLDKKIIVYHLTKLNLKVPYNEVHKIKYNNKTIFIKEDKMDLKLRREKIKKHLPIKYFYEKSFDSSARNKILAEVNLLEANNKNIFNCGQLLKKDQEYHLFRKYNYLKYRLFKLTEVDIDRLKMGSIEQIEATISKIEETRNTLLKSNTRLIVKPVTRYFDQDTFNGDEFISNGYFYIIRAIDCFDYRRGFKFSTYCTWVLRNNLLRDRGKMFDKRVILLDDYNNDQEKKYEPVDPKEIIHDNHEYNKSVIRNMFDKLKESNIKDVDTKIEIIERLYGLNEKNPALLKDVGESLGLSKERIRQIKNETIERLQKSNFIYDPVI